MAPSRKRIQKQRVFLQPGAPKLTSKWSPKSMKTVPCRIFFTTKKTTKFQQHFFLDVPAFREARTLKIKPNHCRVDQKRGYHGFLEKRKLFKKISKSDPPMDPPEAINSVKSTSRPRQKKLQKKEKKMRRKPVNLVKQRNGKNIELEKNIPGGFGEGGGSRSRSETKAKRSRSRSKGSKHRRRRQRHKQKKKKKKAKKKQKQ